MGSIYKSIKKRKDGAEREVWTVDYRDPFGKRKRLDFDKKAKAENKLKEIESEIDSGSYGQKDKTLTFENAAKEYMELHAEIHCKPSTIKGYKANLNNHINPTFGKIKLIDINRKSVEKFIQVKKQQNLSAKTINNCLTLMGSILQRALDNGQIGQNPVLKVRRLSVPHQEMRILTIEEINKVLDKTRVEYPDFYPLLITAIMTGMRRGELLGLTWDRINWDSKQIYVIKSLYKNQLIEPKTLASIRKINMSDDVIKALREWKLKCPVSDMDLVFPNSDGQPMDADNMVKRRFEPVLRKAGIDRIRFHDLRHTYASILIAQNVPIKYIQMQMGHSSIQVTMDRYGHLMPEVYQQGIEALNSLFEPADIPQPVEKNQNSSS